MKHSAQGFGKPQLQAIATINGNGANVGGFKVQELDKTSHPFFGARPHQNVPARKN